MSLLALSDHTIALFSLAVASIALAVSIAAVAIAAYFAGRGEARERERHLRERSAELEIVEASFSDHEDKVRTYIVDVRNFGAASARRVNAVIVDGANLEPIGLLAYRYYAAAITIAPGEVLRLPVEVGLGLWSRSLRFRLFWSDDAGDHEVDGPMCPRDAGQRGDFGPLVAWKPSTGAALGS